MGKDVLLSQYRVGRSCLLTVVVLTLINIVMSIFEISYSLLFSAFMPQVVVILAKYFFSGLETVLVILIFALIPVALLMISYLLSAKDWKWMLVASIIMVIDAICLVVYTVMGYFDFSLVINYGFEAAILFILIRATIAGKDLNNDFDGLTQTIVVNQNGTIEVERNDTVKCYYYDSKLAKENKISRFWLVAVALLVIVVVGPISMVGIIFGLVEGKLWMLILGILGVAMMVLVCIMEAQLTPFNDAKHFWFYKENGIVCRASSSTLFPIKLLANLMVEKETSTAYYCSYVDQNGKRKKIVIAKCYPEIEEILY